MWEETCGNIKKVVIRVLRESTKKGLPVRKLRGGMRKFN